MTPMDTDDTDLAEEEAAASEDDGEPKHDIALVLGDLTDEQRAGIEQQLASVDAKLDEVTAQLTELSTRDTWRSSGVHVELFDSGQTMIKATVEDTEEEIEFNVELRPSNF